ncbi:MAG: hypothetical protein KDA37_10400 [Planctomycetales bacterium]|nr:hypothetical protein [Planctomycetales bacterium]
MTLTLNNLTGDYQAVLTTTPARPFAGDFRVNLNLFNPDVGSTTAWESFFSDTLNDLHLASPSQRLILSGSMPRLSGWRAGHRVSSHSGPFGNPDGISLFHSEVRNTPGQAPTGGDNLGDAVGYGSAILVPEPISMLALAIAIQCLLLLAACKR